MNLTHLNVAVLCCSVTTVTGMLLQSEAKIPHYADRSSCAVVPLVTWHRESGVVAKPEIKMVRPASASTTGTAVF